eukprot:m.374105 g.374105  ORF g.374105 m.374105 type:complete len:110 (-) comp56158_c0_seq15:426-755(-)
MDWSICALVAFLLGNSLVVLSQLSLSCLLVTSFCERVWSWPWVEHPSLSGFPDQRQEQTFFLQTALASVAAFIAFHFAPIVALLLPICRPCLIAEWNKKRCRVQRRLRN